MTQEFSSSLRALVAQHLTDGASNERLLELAGGLLGIPGEPRINFTRPFSAEAEIPLVRFEKLRIDGIETDLVTDHDRGLIWTGTTLDVGKVDFRGAEAAVAGLDKFGMKDWRLPTVQELLSLVDYERHDPAINTSLFACKSDWYWTSTPAAFSPADYAWIVYFGNGYAGWLNRGDPAFVRAVRPSQ